MVQGYESSNMSQAVEGMSRRKKMIVWIMTLGMGRGAGRGDRCCSICAPSRVRSSRPCTGLSRSTLTRLGFFSRKRITVLGDVFAGLLLARGSNRLRGSFRWCLWHREGWDLRG
jgi:hypothetical protein